MFGTLTPQSQDLLIRFQAKLATIITAPGGIEFNDYRAYQNPERAGAQPERFIDGELIERFLDLDDATQQEACRGLGPSVEAMRSMVEELKRMH